ncbi:hypothetical protein M409DRAFT_19570 [Zasmidium cellare ATCC 36951]|uniref:Zn(2)-C6 fungal-type domain-containing protein n=1 Tax=Zasmidium cellare ATCC 36951 TaxID=1080233 RepID=A0A6A6CSA3_ZASCE|nr:uncharacterized protein M409DRAFT_19570 [Zasmidium cellare ATCC 36951]KAF2169955.1 hypothetical protein M409DRAFT_19570 [Zasmidium cellare ATCC 36951]
MNTPRSSNCDLAAKKSRATSCTNCRQVKLKCDLKEKYPNPCSRCAANRHECRTDASFKRVPARSRIKDLESQIDQLKRDRAFSQATSTTSIEHTPELERRSSENGPANDHLTTYAISEVLSRGSPSSSDLSRTETRWLNLVELEEPLHFTLGGISIPFGHAVELFQHFEQHYFPHFCILEPITSLKRLFEESQFLFRAIILIAARSHERHVTLVDSCRPYLDRLQLTIIAEAVPSLLNLQALLLLCAFPFQESCPLYRDSGWTQLGLAINVARQMGLDKGKDEALYGTGTVPDSLNRHARHYRNMTWMKCFELDVQMSCWHGHLPSLVGSQFVRVTANFCETTPSHKYAAVVSVDVELAQALASLEDPAQAHSKPVRTFVERLNVVKTRWSAAWTLDAELELLIAKLYLYGAYLSGLELAPRGDDSFTSETLQATRIIAVQLASLITNLSADGQANALKLGFLQNYDPFPGRPKHHMRSAFYTAIVLFKYLDDDHRMTEEDRETAHNAFGRLYQMFSTCSSTNGGTDAMNAARTLQVIGKAIGQGRGHLKAHVTTRMGASLVHNAVWLASQIQAQEAQQANENALRVSPLPPRLPASENAFLIPPHTQPYNVPSEGYSSSNYAATTAAFEDAIFSAPVWDGTAVSLPNPDFAGYGVWDNSLFDNWQTSMPYPPGVGTCT